MIPMLDEECECMPLGGEVLVLRSDHRAMHVMRQPDAFGRALSVSIASGHIPRLFKRSISPQGDGKFQLLGNPAAFTSTAAGLAP
jgi:hypothetical protein